MLTKCLRRFEVQLSAVKERLEAAKQGSTRGLGSQMDSGGSAGGGGGTFGGFSFSGMGSRIAKPLRGGGGGTDTAYHGAAGPVVPTLSNLQMQEAEGRSKRSSWFFDRR